MSQVVMSSNSDEHTANNQNSRLHHANFENLGPRNIGYMYGFWGWAIIKVAILRVICMDDARVMI